ncbi:transposase, partial [Vibrio parahaemolyticus]|uniref:transposase n=1 Tax=Vibrio parahaemolyticus TaxID=670 RepID=UPI001174332F
EEAIAEWKQNKQGKRGRPRRFSDLAITTALMVKRIFSMPLRALQGFLDSVFKLAIDATGLKVYGEGEWKVKKHG